MEYYRACCWFLLWVTCLISCDYYFIEPHRNQVGHIETSEILGDDSFALCFEEKQFPFYYGRNPSGFRPGKDSLRNYFFQNFNNFGDTSKSGFITIRFVINCEGEAGRYVVHQVGPDFKRKEFNPKISEQLLELVQELDDWKPINFNDDIYDSFIFLSFKIENGEIVAILP